MKLISVLVFYSEKKEKDAPGKEAYPEWNAPKKETKLSSRILQAKYELLNYPLGREYAQRAKNRTGVALKEYELELDSPYSETETQLTPLEFDPVLVPPIKLKTECCEKYLKGKRCGRCPCFDLPNGPASRMN